MKNGLSQIIVNIEAQKDEPTEYKICLLYTSIKGLNVNDKNGTAGTYAIDAISDAI